jgi:D-glycero-D-manno-heptose 1,7-bisphosphate phosphatase
MFRVFRVFRGLSSYNSGTMKQRRFVILDRDGTLIVERHYLSDPRQVELLANAASGLRHMRERGLGLVVITNQSGIGRGFFDEARLHRIHQRMNELLEAEGITLDGLYFCPHVPEDNCLCRKPRTGLIELASKELGFHPQDCFVIGDKACDIKLGQRVGATTFLVRTGYGSQELAHEKITPDYVVDNLWEAAQVIQGLY